MKVIRYQTKLKASGDEYRKIVFWNRFLRNMTESFFTVLPAILSIAGIIAGYYGGILIIVYAIAFIYPIFILSQFKSTVNYHLKHRDPSEDAPCEVTFMTNGVMFDIPEFDRKEIYEWDGLTTIYDKFGYYMMFEKGTMTFMLRKADIPDELKNDVVAFIKENVNQNKCVIRF